MARTKSNIKKKLLKAVKKENNSEIKPGENEQSRKLAAFWLQQVEFVEKENKPWIKKGNDVIKRFRDERNRADESTLRRLNTLWANIKILKPALYGKKPIPVIERKFLQRDPTGRISATILERTTKNQMDENGLHIAINRAVMDYLLPGRGVVWVRYEPEIGHGDSLPVTTDSGVEDELAEIDEKYGDSDTDNEETNKLQNTGEQLIAEQAPVDYIDWHDFFMFPPKARTWDEVQAIGKRVYISKKEAKQRFGEEIGGSLKGETTPLGQSSNRQSYSESNIVRDINEKSIIVYEIWNKTDRKLYWVSAGYDYLVDIKEDFLKLKRFFPTPMPISATLTNNSLIPVPDYYEYQDQAIQIDELTQRLALLTKACKVAGTYDASNGALKRLMTEGVENELIPVDAWAVHAEKGGVKGCISFLPIDEIQKVIQTLQQVRQQLMQDLDLVTGISDVTRGTTDSRETLGGIRLKNNNAGTRLSDRQNEVAEFARDVVAIVAEIAAKHFSVKTLIEASGILYDDDMSPESIMEEFQSTQPTQPNNQQQGGAPQAPRPQLPQPQLPMLPGPQTPPANGPGSPPVSVPGMGGPTPPLQPQMQPASPAGGGNVIPFPGMGTGAPNPMQGMLQQLLQSQQPQFDPADIVVQKITKAIELLRKDVPRSYRIEIETDSTIFGDAAQERQDAVEFITAVMQFLTQASTVAKELPEMTPLLGRFLQFGVRKFRVGRDLESAIDMFVRQMDKKSKDAAKNPQASPEQQEMQIEQMKAMLQIQSQKMQMEGQQQKTQLELQAQHVNDQRDMQKAHMEDQRQAELNKMEMAHAQAEHQLQLKEMALKHQIAMRELAMKTQQMQMQMEQSQTEHQQTLEQNRQQHNQTIEQTKLQDKQDKAQHTQKMSQIKIQAKEKDKTRKDKKDNK